MSICPRLSGSMKLIGTTDYVYIPKRTLMIILICCVWFCWGNYRRALPRALWIVHLSCITPQCNYTGWMAGTDKFYVHGITMYLILTYQQQVVWAMVSDDVSVWSGWCFWINECVCVRLPFRKCFAPSVDCFQSQWSLIIIWFSSRHLTTPKPKKFKQPPHSSRKMMAGVFWDEKDVLLVDSWNVG